MSIDPNVNRQAELMRGISPISEAARDLDGFPTIKSIQSMSGEELKRVCDGLPINNKNNKENLKFLGKAAVAALRLGFNGPVGACPGRNLLYQAVSLYAKDLRINPFDLNDDDDLTCVTDLHLRASDYFSHEERTPAYSRDLFDAALRAFNVWVVYEEAHRIR